MKKIAVVSFITLLVAGLNISICIAQSKLSGGVRAGISISNLSGNDVSGSGIFTTPAGGVFLNYHPSSIFSVQPEIDVVSKGGNYEMMLNGFPYHHVRVTYIEIPLLFKLSSSKGIFTPGFRPSIFAGPAFDAMIFHSVQGEMLDNVTGGYSVTQRAKDTAFSFIAGIGGTINNLYVIDLRYNYGLTNAYTRGDAKSSGISLTVGFIF